MQERICPGCGTDLTGTHQQRIFCSTACRTWVHNGHTDLRTPPVACAACGGSMQGKKANALYCTRKCKTATSEQRRPKRNDAERYLREREHRIAAAKDYATRNPHVGQAARRKRRAAQVQAGIFRVSGEDWLSLCRRYGFRCFYCGQIAPLTMDHIIPVARGGRHSIGNLLPACMSCNASKSSRLLIEWRHGRRRGVTRHPLETVRAG